MILSKTQIATFFSLLTICSLVVIFFASNVNAQTMAQGNARSTSLDIDTTQEFKPHGELWGCTFGDFAYKTNADILNRGGTNQYGEVPANTSLFQFRRIYLGFDYELSRRFSVQFTMSSENDYGAPFSAAQGDLLQNNKFSPFIKYANIRWKNIWRGSDFVIGAQNTPAYGKTGRDDQTPEEVWAYRSVERTISDIYGTPCYDMGASLQGWFDHNGNFGYNLMAGNGSMAKPETDLNKWFYGNVYAKFLDKRIVINLYQDYERLNWGVYVPAAKPRTASPNGAWYHDRNMTKLFAAWNTKLLTVGFEGFRNTILGDVRVVGKDGGNLYYRTSQAMAWTVFVRGRILSNPAGNALLGYFARYDNFDPTGNLSAIVNDPNIRSYTAVTGPYDPTTKQQFIIAGLDFTPYKNIHLMPNLWLNTYNSSLSQNAANDALNPLVTGIKGTDVVWRLSFYYVYGR
jgi:hypothetical protein